MNVNRYGNWRHFDWAISKKGKSNEWSKRFWMWWKWAGIATSELRAASLWMYSNDGSHAFKFLFTETPWHDSACKGANFRPAIGSKAAVRVTRLCLGVPGLSLDNFNKHAEGQTCCLCREQSGENQMPWLRCGTLCSVRVALAEHRAEADDLAARRQISCLGKKREEILHAYNYRIWKMKRMCWSLLHQCSNFYRNAQSTPLLQTD